VDVAGSTKGPSSAAALDSGTTVDEELLSTAVAELATVAPEEAGTVALDTPGPACDSLLAGVSSAFSGLAELESPPQPAESRVKEIAPKTRPSFLVLERAICIDAPLRTLTINNLTISFATPRKKF
jgi:hypothetical protein